MPRRHQWKGRLACSVSGYSPLSLYVPSLNYLCCISSKIIPDVSEVNHFLTARGRTLTQVRCLLSLSSTQAVGISHDCFRRCTTNNPLAPLPHSAYLRTLSYLSARKQYWHNIIYLLRSAAKSNPCGRIRLSSLEPVKMSRHQCVFNVYKWLTYLGQKHVTGVLRPQYNSGFNLASPYYDAFRTPWWRLAPILGEVSFVRAALHPLDSVRESWGPMSLARPGAYRSLRRWLMGRSGGGTHTKVGAAVGVGFSLVAMETYRLRCVTAA
jgi:hypothetical protein